MQHVPLIPDEGPIEAVTSSSFKHCVFQVLCGAFQRSLQMYEHWQKSIAAEVQYF
jgi:hypothetical protein